MVLNCQTTKSVEIGFLSNTLKTTYSSKTVKYFHKWPKTHSYYIRHTRAYHQLSGRTEKVKDTLLGRLLCRGNGKGGGKNSQPNDRIDGNEGWGQMTVVTTKGPQQTNEGMLKASHLNEIKEGTFYD